MEEANKLIGTGKKHLVMGKVVEAVGALQDACGMLAKKYGDTADECGEAFFWCGKALLDLARMENSVLGNALEGVPEEDDEEKPKDSNGDSTENIDEKARDELRVQVYDAMAEKKNEDVDGKPSKDEEKGDAKKSEAGDEKQNTAEKDEGKNEKCDSTKDEKEDEKEAEKKSGDEEEIEDGEEEDCDDAEMEADAEEQGEEDGAAEKDSDDDEEEEEEEEVGNLQLAWEMLEVAKVIYKRKETKEDQLMAAQAHLKLGEVSSESGNYTQSLEDFRECLKLQVKHLDSDSRLLAETHYQLGLTYSLDVQYGRAIEELKSSISVIKSRLDKLQVLLDGAEGPDALPDERKEMEELKALLPEIQEKVEDATEGLKMAAAEAGKAALDGGSTSSAFPVSTVQKDDSSSSSKFTSTSSSTSSSVVSSTVSKAPVSDISHLVRKKRKPEESPVKEVKKVKQNDGQANGVHKANGDTNGHADSKEVKSQ